MRACRLALHHEEPPAPIRGRHRDALDLVPAPLHDAPRLPRLPAPPAQVLGMGAPPVRDGRVVSWARSLRGAEQGAASKSPGTARCSMAESATPTATRRNDS